MNPQEIIQLRQRVEILEHQIGMLTSNRNVYKFENPLVGGTSGLKLATSPTLEKIGFWGVTPVIQPVGDTNGSGQYAGSGTAVKNDDTFDGDGSNSTKYSISGIVKSLKNVGILKN